MKNFIFSLLCVILFFIIFFPQYSKADVLCSKSGYTILTINGIFTDKESARKNASLLRWSFKDKTFNNEPLTVDFLYNQTHGKVFDLLDSANQKFFSQNSFEIEDSDFAQMLNDASSKVKTQKLLLVGHSQGNFYANTLYNNLVDKPGGVPGISFGVYGVANPASYVAGAGKYLTSSTDSVINKIRILGSESVLPSNVDIELNEEDGNGHSFSNVYLKYQASRIVSDIKYSLDRLENNDEKQLEELCIDPVEFTLSQKIQDIFLTSTDLFFDDIIPNIKEKYLALVNGTGNAIASVTFKINKILGNLSANVVDSLPDSSALTTLNPDIIDSSFEGNDKKEQEEKTEENVEEKKVEEKIKENIIEEKIIEQNVKIVEENKEVVEEENKGELVNNNYGGGGSASISDTNPPTVTLLGDNPFIITKGEIFTDPGISAVDDKEGNVSFISEGIVNTSIVDSYTITYSATDSSGNISKITREVKVVAPPLITTTIDTNTTLEPGIYNYDNLLIKNNSTLTLLADPNSSNSFKGVEIRAYNITIETGSYISTDNQGYGNGPGTPENYEYGASYGGRGGGVDNTASIYGSSIEPNDLGSGKEGVGRGGGAMRLIVYDTLKNDGLISANAGGARATGGSIYVKTSNLSGVGNFTTNGSGSAWPNSTGGSGGRIAIYYDNSSFSGNVQALAGTYCFYGCNPAGETGTVGLFDVDDDYLTIISDWKFEANHSPFNFKKIIAKNNSKTKIENSVSINTDEFLIDENSTIESLGDVIFNIPDITINNNSKFNFKGGEKINTDNFNINSGAIATLSGEEVFDVKTLRITGNSSTLTILPEKVLKLDIQNIFVGEGSYISAYKTGYRSGPGTQTQPQSGGLYGGNGENYNSSFVYGSAINPVDFGSGGISGLLGGGAIKINVADTLENDGIIYSDGEASSSGGSVYIKTKNLKGNGKFTANGGALHLTAVINAPGGGGRTVIYYENSDFTGKVEAKGGCGSYDGWSMTCANDGTAGMFDTINNDLYIDSSWQFRENDGPFVLNNIYIRNKAKVITDDGVDITADKISLDDSATLTLVGNENINAQNINIIGNSMITVLKEKVLYLDVANIFIENGSSIKAENKGYTNGPGSPDIGEEVGGSYGGRGGGATSKPIYGSKEEPVDFGSGSFGNAGGGAIKINVADTLENNGIISASSISNHSSGGSVYINSLNILGNGEILARGGGSAWPYGGVGGGGGRIAIYYNNYSSSLVTDVSAGTYCFYGCAPAGEAGTIYLVDKNIIVLSSLKDIIKFNFSELIPEIVGVIDNINLKINLSVPFGTDITNLVPNISISDKASINPLNNIAQNFSNPINYIVTAEDGTTQTYEISVLVLPNPIPDPEPTPNPDTTAPQISSFLLNGSSSDITINPSDSNPLDILLTSSENVNWISVKIENIVDSTFYKIFYDGVGCLDGTNTCNKIWEGELSSGGILQDDTTYKIKVHIKDEAGNEFYDFLPSVIKIDTSI